MGMQVTDKRPGNVGRDRRLVADFHFGSTYLNGGNAVSPRHLFGIRNVKTIRFNSYIPGYELLYDYAQQKIKVYKAAPVVVHEEVVTVTGHVGYLRYPAAHINYIASGNNGYIPISGGIAPATGQCAVDLGYNIENGVLTKGQRTKLTFLAADTVTSAKVSYVTQAWKDLTDNMRMAKMVAGAEVYGQGLTWNTDTIRLGEDYCAMTSVTWDDNGTIKVPKPLKAGVATAAGEMGFDYVKVTTFGEIKTRGADNVNAATSQVYIVYIKMPASGFIPRRFSQAQIADASDKIVWTGNPLVYSCCGQLCMETTAKQAKWIAVGATLAAGEIRWTHLPPSLIDGTAVAPEATMEAATDDASDVGWIRGDASEIETQLLEVPHGDDLSTLSAKVEVTGY